MHENGTPIALNKAVFGDQPRVINFDTHETLRTFHEYPANSSANNTFHISTEG